MPKTTTEYFVKLIYVAPENAVDEKGKPIFQYQRDILMSKETYDGVIKEMKAGKTKIFIPAFIRFSDGHEEDRFIYINLDNGNLMFAETAARETLTPEGEEEVKKSGKAVLYDLEGKPLKAIN